MLLLYQPFRDFINEVYDARIEHYPLMGSVYKISAILILYLLVVKKIGPKFMESRKPYNLSTVMKYYNAMQVIANAWCTIYMTKYYLELTAINKTSAECPMANLKNTDLDKRITFLHYIYYILKVSDLCDTIFIILKKNYRQASVLHIYHHTMMAFCSYIHTQYYPGGAYLMAGIVNTFIHVCMYSYFFLTTIRPDLKKSIWWKKHITHLQILQFTYLVVYFLRIVMNENCKYSKFWSVFAVTQNIVLSCLFGNFYLRNYVFVKTKGNNKIVKTN